MSKFKSGIAGRRNAAPQGITFHNDAGSQNATSQFYRGWLPQQVAANGFAHFYVASDGTYQAEAEENIAWHAGNRTANTNYLAIEICQSLGTEAVFLQNEQQALQLAARLFKKYGWSVNETTVRVHQEFSATSCPHRSIELHGGNRNTAKNYFIAQLQRLLANNTLPPAPQEPPKPTSPNPPTVNSGWQRERGTFVIGVAAGINLRVGATTSAGIIAHLPQGARVNYDQYKIDSNGHVWIRQPRQNGYGYLATGTSANGRRQTYWGRFY